MIHRSSILVALIAMLAGCAGAPAAVAPTSVPVAATNAPLATSVPSAAPTSAPTASAALPATITHDRGSITLEQPAERIVVFSEEFTEIMIALDLAPVGVALWRNQPSGDTFTQLPYLNQPIPGQPRYIDGNTPNLEAIAALQPDLIIHHDYGDEAGDKLYESLKQIAPTVAYSGGEVGGWKRAIQGIAQATDRVPQAEQVIATYDARVAALTAEMAPVVQQAPVVTLLLSGVDFVGVFDERFAIGGLMQTLGFRLTVPEGATLDKSGYAAISAEILNAIRADSVVTMRFDADKAHLADPILATLNMPILTTEIYQGMGYTGPFAEVIYLEGFAQAFRNHYLAGAALSPTRTVTDDLGRSVTVPVNPQRIVALQDLQVLRPLLDLGVTPIAAVTHPRAEGAFRFVEEYDVSGIEVIGLLGEPNMEQLVLLKPDLIIGTLSAGTDGQIETLSAIAPTVVYNAGRPVIDYHRSLAEAVGALDAYDALMADYETRLAELRAGVAPISDELVVSLLAFNPNAGQIEIGEGPYTLIFRGAGINQPEPQVNFASADAGVRRYWISLEQLPEHDADLILLLYSNDPAVNAPITDSPIWSQLKAVQAGQVVEIDGGTWYVQSVRSLFNVIDALEQHLVETAVDTSVFE